jgi:ATP-dependent exoDNAse (exonuclease V) beta subunit
MELKSILSAYNSHERDKFLVFDEPRHKYSVTTDPKSFYTSVTTFNHGHFPKFNADEVIENMMKGKNWNPENKYWGLTPTEIKSLWKQNSDAVSGAGTDLHYNIECFMNQDLPKGYTHRDLLENYETRVKNGIIKPFNDSEEWGYFLQFVRASPRFKPYRTEWMIYEEDLKIAGAIDMVYENPDGTLSIYDWKRSKEITKTNGFNKYALTEEIEHIPDTNFWHYSLQLNTYKAILERKYGKTVNDLYLVRLHPLNNPKKTFELIKCANLTKEVADLFEVRKNNMKNMK